MMDSSDGVTRNFDEEESVIEYQYGIPNSIVYTTKLDEMNILKENTADMCVDTIINSIIKESKPKLNKKQKWTRASSDYSYEDLSSFIKTFNIKVDRIAKKNNHLLSMCRPVRVVLEDIKYGLHTQSEASKNSKINEPLPTYTISRKLEVKMVYDQQHGEADMYLLDKRYLLQGYNKFRIDNINDDTFNSLTFDKNVFEVSCCCWYNREKFLKTLAILPNHTVRFMRKPHKCAVNLCRCCCRNKAIRKSDVTTSTSPSLQKPSDSPGVWLTKMPKKHVSLPTSAKSTYTLLSKSLSVASKPSVKIDMPVIEGEVAFLHSTNIDFGNESYVIGADGHIKLHLKHCKDEQKLPCIISKTANNVVGNICCWYKREEFASRLLALRALPDTVNYIRGVHPCSPTFCSCCCMPSNTEKTEIACLPKAARHTNDLVSKKVNIKVRFSDVVEKPVKPTSAKPAAVGNTNDIVSFHVSLSSFDKLSKGKSRSFPPLITNDASRRSVRVLVEKSSKHKNKTVIECTQPLNNFTTKELRMLDMIFRAVKNAFSCSSAQTFEFKQTKNIIRQPKKYTGCDRYVHNTIYPLLLNKQLSIVADLRSKRFLPPLKAHLEKYHVPVTDNCSTWLRNEQRCRKARQTGLQQK